MTNANDIASTNKVIARQRPTFWSAAIHSAVLGLLFLVVYGGTSWLTELRAPVPTLYFEWERFIPFLPSFTIPYLSIDLFFVVAPFLCASREELRLFSRRIAMAIIVAGICFLLFPLQLAIERPVASGWMGAIYNWFTGMDRPYNLCPSLHIALRTILAHTYSRNTRGATRLAVNVWFSLIGVSTLVLYQHHVIDVVGGFILAGVCYYVVRSEPFRRPVVSSPSIGVLYGGVAVLSLVAVFIVWPYGILFAWPAVACLLLVTAYAGTGPGLFRKSNGVFPISARLVMWPVLLGQQLSLLYYKRQCHKWDAVTERVWIGRRLSDDEAAEAIDQGVTAVLDLTVAFDEAKPLRNLDYLNVQVLDLTAPTPEQLREAVEFIESRSRHGIVYVHCKIGYSRSAAVVCAWLLHAGNAETADEAITILRECRPAVVIRPEIRKALSAYEASRHRAPSG